MREDREVLTKLLAFVTREFGNGAKVEPDQQLMPDLVDSLGVFVLAEFVEHEFQVTLEDIDLSAENLVSTMALSTLVNDRLRYSLKHKTA